jgi:glycine/serine hydroxymethyltransferase
MFLERPSSADPQIQDAIRREFGRERTQLATIPAEDRVSRAVLEVLANPL